MAAKTQLHQLLQEDQEPFHLHEFIADRRTTSSKNQLHLTRIKKSDTPTTTTSKRNSSIIHFPVTFCKNACFNAKHDSPDLNRASPVFYIPKSPVKLLQIPSKTAALLLEAALRIQKTTSSKKHTRSFFGSVLKKLAVKTHKRNNIKTGIQTTSLTAFGFGKDTRDSKSNHSDMDFSFDGRRSDAVWSEGKSLDTETSWSSSNSDLTRTIGERTRSSSRCPSPDFSSHPPSPNHRAVKDGDEEEKEQCSPVCVLDPAFEEDEDDHGYSLECSYSIIQRKKHRILEKLSRLEALADLDPKDLDKLILEDDLYDEADLEMLYENDDIVSEISSVPEDEFLQQVLKKCFHDLHRIPVDMIRLVSDLIAEEEMKDELLNHKNDVVNTVSSIFSSWKEVEQDTIDMMIGEDFRRESWKWKTNKEELRIVAMDIELGIFASLVREIFM